MTGPGVPEQPAAPDAAEQPRIVDLTSGSDPTRPEAYFAGPDAVAETCAAALQHAAADDLAGALSLARHALVDASAPPGPARLPLAVALQTLALVHALRGDGDSARRCAGEAAVLLEVGLVLRG